MLFGEGLRLSSMMATHPPLLERIQALGSELQARGAARPARAVAAAAAGRAWTRTSRSACTAAAPARCRGAAQLGHAQSAGRDRPGRRAAGRRLPSRRHASTTTSRKCCRTRRARPGRRGADAVRPAACAAGRGARRAAVRTASRAPTCARAEQALDYADRMADLQPDAAPAAGLAGLPAVAPPAARRARAVHGHRVRAGARRRRGRACSSIAWAACCSTQVAEALDPVARLGAGRRAGSAERDHRGRGARCWPWSRRPATPNPADAPRAYLAGLARVYPAPQRALRAARRHAGRARRGLAEARRARADRQGIAGRGPGRGDQPRRAGHGRRGRAAAHGLRLAALSRCRRCSTVRRRGPSFFELLCAAAGGGGHRRPTYKTSCFVSRPLPLSCSASPVTPTPDVPTARVVLRSDRARKPLFP